MANKLFLHYSLRINYTIELNLINSKLLKIPFKLLYKIFKNKLLVLKKVLIKYLNKKFIKINKSSATVLVLFIKKFKKKLKFCVNY